MVNETWSASFQASTANQLRIVLFWVITQRLAVIAYRRFGPIRRVGPTGCPETSVSNYHYSLRNDPEEHSYPLNLKCFPFMYIRLPLFLTKICPPSPQICCCFFFGLGALLFSFSKLLRNNKWFWTGVVRFLNWSSPRHKVCAIVGLIQDTYVVISSITSDCSVYLAKCRRRL